MDAVAVSIIALSCFIVGILVGLLLYAWMMRKAIEKLATRLKENDRKFEYKS